MVPPLRTIQTLLLSIGFWSFAFGQNSQPVNYIRVAIIQDAPSLILKIKGFYEVFDAKNNQALDQGKNINTTVTTYKDGILLGGLKSETNRLLIKSGDPEAIIINGRMFRGNIELIKKDNLHLLVVNHIELEDYIKGILYHEVSHYWPNEALKAQAIICRTYALYQMQESKGKDFDVTCDIYSQVYGGRSSERFRTNRVVDATRSQILTYQGNIFSAYYHATCGGHTEDASLLWQINIAPLRGVVCNFCKDSPHFKWHAVLSRNDIKNALVKAGYKIREMKSITILGKDNSDRIKNLEITTDKKEIEFSAKDFRTALGPNLIRSANFSVNVIAGDVVFEGFGWGHGVGLCQWGAYFMAKQGYNYQEILKYYYPGADVKTLGF